MCATKQLGRDYDGLRAITTPSPANFMSFMNFPVFLPAENEEVGVTEYFPKHAQMDDLVCL